MKKIALWTILFTAVATPAMATFWVVQDTTTQKCAVVEQAQKPISTARTTVIGDAHATRAEAESVANRNVQCGGAD